MSTFKHPEMDVPVTLTSDITEDQLLNFPAFKQWTKKLQKSLSLQSSDNSHPFHATPYKLRSVKLQSVDWFGGKRIGFIKLKAEVTNDNGEYLPGSVFLRGGSVGMMIVLQPDDVPEGEEKEKHVILTMQPRIPAGSLNFPELPAGMLDDSGSFAGGAAKEIKEEIGLEIPEAELTNLTELAIAEDEEGLERAVFPSAGGCDEFIPIFLHQRRVKRNSLEDWQGKLTGLRNTGEKITLKLVKLEELWRQGGRDAKALAAWGLYEGLRKEGKI